MAAPVRPPLEIAERVRREPVPSRIVDPLDLELASTVTAVLVDQPPVVAAAWEAVHRKYPEDLIPLEQVLQQEVGLQRYPMGLQQLVPVLSE